MAEENDVELAEQPRAKLNTKLIILPLLGLVIAAGAVLATLYATGTLSSLGDRSGEETSAEAEAAPEQAEAVYVSLEPAFTVNLNQAGNARYLQLTLEAMTRDPEVESSLKQHMPVIRNDLMMIFSAQSPGALRSRQGKEALRAETLASIQGILVRETGSPGVEAIYFTSFVMQ